MQLKLIAMAAGMSILAGCATTSDGCVASDGDASLVTKLSCDVGGGYRARVDANEQQVLLDREENALLRDVLEQIEAQQHATQNELKVTRAEQDNLEHSMRRLISRLQQHTGEQLGLQQQLNSLEDKMQQGPQAGDSRSLEERQAHLKSLQSQVSRLQESLGY